MFFTVEHSQIFVFNSFLHIHFNIKKSILMLNVTEITNVLDNSIYNFDNVITVLKILDKLLILFHS